MRNKFDEQLAHLNDELTTMGALCEEAISGCVKYLMEGSDDMRDTALEADRQIDQKESDIERLCMRLLLQQQPVATDLRVISSAPMSRPVTLSLCSPRRAANLTR